MKLGEPWRRIEATAVLILSVAFAVTARSETPVVTSVHPDQAFTDEDTRITIVGESFEPQARPALEPSGMIGSLPIGYDAVAVATAGRYAYLADRYRGLMIADIGDPSAPRWVFTGGPGLSAS